MNKEFIPYEQALDLEELGFDEPCFAIYCFKELRIGIFSNLSSAYNTILAPLYQQSFTWFREKYGLVVTNPPTEMSNLIYFKATIYKYKPIRLGNTVDVLYNKTFKTPEEAELACLVKLIDIVKKQNLKN
jgi:hypothetical protein